MKRKEAREFAMRLVFALGENTGETAGSLITMFRSPDYFQTLAEEDSLYEKPPDSESDIYIERVVRGIEDHFAEIDGYIEKHSKNRAFSRISRSALAAMRVAAFEVLYMPDEVPPRAAINAALDLVRLYDTEETVKFANGVLGAFARTDLPEGQVYG